MTPKQPGKLGNPEATLASDPRTDPRIATAMAMFGELAPGVDAIDTNINYELALKYCAAFEDAVACHTQCNGKPFRISPPLATVKR